MIIEIFQKWINYRNTRALATLGILGLIGVTLVVCSGNTTTEEEMVVEPTVVAEVEKTQEESKMIVDIAVGDGRFTTLVTALQAADP